MPENTRKVPDQFKNTARQIENENAITGEQFAHDFGGELATRSTPDRP